MDEFSIRGRALSLDAEAVLVVADLHVGRDESSNVEYPLGERTDLRERLGAHVERFAPERVVFAGDVIHAHGTASPASVSAVRELISICREHDADPVVVAGNHDGSLSDVWGGEVHEEYVVEGGIVESDRSESDGSDGDGDQYSDRGCSDGILPTRTVVCHGHEPPAMDADRYVIGHDHPSIEIEGVRHPCSLVGYDVYRGADVLMLPAFSRIAPGVVVNDMRSGAFRSPLVTDVDAFRPIIYDEGTSEVLEFPPLGEFRELL